MVMLSVIMLYVANNCFMLIAIMLSVVVFVCFIIEVKIKTQAYQL